METKQKFLDNLRTFVLHGGAKTPDEYGRLDYSPMRGQVVLMSGLGAYLETHTPGDELGLNWLYYLPQYVGDAFSAFRNGREWQYLREAYLNEMGSVVPDLVDVRGESHRQLVVHALCRLLPLLAGEDGGTWLSVRLESYFDAQGMVVKHAWHRFVRTGYRELLPRIKTEYHRGNIGEFGGTTLETYAMAGRVCFTFTRPNGSEMTFIADDSDMHGHRSGPNFSDTPYAEVVSMIDEVSDNWNMAKMLPTEAP